MYSDALLSAKELQQAVDALIADPTDATLKAARDAWKAARNPYMQTEGFRFGNSVVDDWEGEVNSWPLDEGLIDYVDADLYGEESDENPLYTANVIANPKIRIGADMIDATTITPALLKRLQGAMDVEANVATGYHAIEFLLWGQDLHGTGPGAGERPATDYSLSGCTHGNCDRRGAYLKAATDFWSSDLDGMVGDWRRRRRRAPVCRGEGRRRRAFHHPDRARLALLRRACRRADEARPDPARSGGGAGLLLRQHAQQPLLRRGRHVGDLDRQI